MDSDAVMVFDLNGILTESKTEIDNEMVDLITTLSRIYRIGIITGETFEQVKAQVLNKLPKETYPSIKVFPTNGSVYATFKRTRWALDQLDGFSKSDKERIIHAFEAAFKEINWQHPDCIYGELIEDRGTQMTFSALGQDAPLVEKCMFDPTGRKRFELAERLKEFLPDFEIKLGGTTSIDVNKKGIDKAYGIRRIRDELNVPEDLIVYIGRSIKPGGSNSSVLNTRALCYEVEDVPDTKQLIRRIINYEI
jgi:phosphomannomutase